MKTNALYLFLISLLTSFAPLPGAQAVNPPPDGCYPAFNTAEGCNALNSLTGGAANTAIGWNSLFADTDGSFNTGLGAGTLLSNTNGQGDTAIGAAALLFNTGNFNTALGAAAGIDNNTGSNNIYIGDRGFSSENNVISIGAVSSTGTAYQACFIGGIFGAGGTTGADVGINNDGKLGPFVSSARFKEDIQPMGKASEVLFALKPVTFRYKKEIDPEDALRFGLVAEEVAKVNPDLVVLDGDRKPYSVRYRELNAMLLNEFLKAHRKIQELEANDAEQQREIKALIATVKEQAVQIQKVTAQLELSKTAPQTVVNNQ